MGQPSNDWEQAYDASIRREEQAVQALSNFAFLRFLIDLRAHLMVAGVVIGVGLRWGLYWIALGAFFVIGAFMWWRYSHRNRR